MKTSKVLLIVIVVVLINNVLLLSYLSKDSKPSIAKDSEGKELVARSEPSNIDYGEDKESRALGKGVATQTGNVSLGEPVIGLDENISSAVKQYIKSDEFEQVLDNYQMEAAPRYEDMQSRLSAMSASELYSLAIDSSNSFEQKHAQQLLIQNGLGDLGNAELKTLYHAEGVSEWVQQNLLPRLLEDGDSEAIVWAKRLLDDDSRVQYISSEVYSSVYDADPDFVKQQINDLDLNHSLEMTGAMGFIMGDEDLSKLFYEANFDKLLDLKNSQIYEYLYNPAEVELSNQQQSRLSELFSSKNSKRREFAIRQAGNIDDVNALRDAYSQLSKNSEKLSLLQTLSQNRSNADVVSLVQELAADSDNAQIRKMIRR